jgi:hypothetical protein
VSSANTKLLETATRYFKSCTGNLEEAPDPLPLILIYTDSDGNMAVCQVTIGQPGDTRIAAKKLREILIEAGAMEYTIVMEAYQSIQEKGEKFVPPRQASNRTSVVMAITCDRSGNTAAVVGNISGTGKERRVTQPEQFDGNIGGELASLLAPTMTPQ